MSQNASLLHSAEVDGLSSIVIRCATPKIGSDRCDVQACEITSHAPLALVQDSVGKVVRLGSKQAKRLMAIDARRSAFLKMSEAAQLERILATRAKKFKSGKARRRAVRRVKGLGAYDMGTSLTGLIPRGLGAAYNWFKGGSAEEGWNRGASVSRLLGMGAYGVPWSSAGGSGHITSMSASPSITNQPDGVTIAKEEFLDVISSAQNYTVHSYPIQPGLASTFRWCSGIAQNFQNYRIRQMLVRFESQLTNAVASFESMGTIMICAKTNAAAPPPADQAEFEQTEFATVVRPNKSVTAPIEMNPREGAGGTKSVRVGSLPPSTSINDYDSGNLFVAVAGMPADNIIIGRLYIYYEIELFNPVLITRTSGECQYIQNPGTTGAGITTPFGKGDAPLVKHEDTFGTSGVSWVTIPLADPNTGYGYVGVRLPAGTRGTFILENEVTGTTSGGTPAQIVWTLTNCTQSGYNFYILGGSGYNYDTIPNAACAKCIQRMCFTVIDPSAPVTIQYSSGGANWPTDVTAYCTRIYEVTPNVATSLIPRGISDSDVDRIVELIRSKVTIGFDEEKYETLSSTSLSAAASLLTQPSQRAARRAIP